MTSMIAVEIRNDVVTAIHRVNVEKYRDIRRFEGFRTGMRQFCCSGYTQEHAKARWNARRLIQHFWTVHGSDWQAQIEYEKRVYGLLASGPLDKAPVIEHQNVQEFFEYVGYNSKSKKLQSWAEIK